MLIENLWNNEITLDIVQKMISASMKTYDINLNLNMNDSTNRNAFISFLSDDIYEFDSISRFAKLMIDSELYSTNWKNILSLVQNYNLSISNNEKIYKLILSLLQYYPKTSSEYLFINKIINSSLKSGIALKHTRLSEIDNKILLIENKLASDYNDNIPTIDLSLDELDGMPKNVVDGFYNDVSQKYTIHLSKQMYNMCHKFISKSNIRQKIDDKMYDSYKKNITKLTYLFIYKHVKANMLGYESYFDYLSHHDINIIRTILENIIIELRDRCDLEMAMLSQLKKTSENNAQLNTWDISYYLNKWKLLYGINETEISQYFELNNTLTNIFLTLSSIFPFKFIKTTKTKKIFDQIKDIYYYDIMFGNKLIGEIVFDFFARPGKFNGTHTVCINNKCYYPFEKKIMNCASIVVSMCLNKSQPTLLTLSDLTTLFCEVGKIIYYLSCTSKFSLFGGMYSDIDFVDTIGKFVELVLFEKNTIKNISKHFSNNSRMSDSLTNKLIQHRKLDYGINYKYQCMYGLYDLFVHSQVDFINNCKSLMCIQNVAVQKEKIVDCMYNIYNMFYDTIFNVGNVSIHKDNAHFHPVLWACLFNGSETINCMKILSDIYAHDLFQQYSSCKSKQEFCSTMISSIANSSAKNQLNIDCILGRPISHSHMLDYFGLNDNDSLLSLYNIDPNKKISSRHSPQKYNQYYMSVYLSPDAVIKNHTCPPANCDKSEQVTDTDSSIQQVLSKIMH